MIAWSERRLYAELVAEYGEYHVPEKGDQKHSGGVILILPDTSKPAPVIEAKAIKGALAEDSSPMLILPSALREETNA